MLTTTKSKQDGFDEGYVGTPTNSPPEVCRDKTLSTSTDTGHGVIDEAHGDTLSSSPSSMRRDAAEQPTVLEQIIKLATEQDMERKKLSEKLAIMAKNLEDMTEKWNKSTKDLADTNEKLEKSTKDLADTNEKLDKSTKDLMETTKKFNKSAKVLADTNEKLADTTRKLDESTKDLEDTYKKLADTTKKSNILTKDLAEKTKKLNESTKDLADTTKRLDITAKDLVDTTEKLGTKTVECETLCDDLAAARAKQESIYLSQVQQRPILPDASGVASVSADANRLVHSFPVFREELMYFTWYPASSKYMSVGLRAELLQTMKKSDTIVRSLQALSINLQPSVKDVVDKLVIFGQGWNTYLNCSTYWHVGSRYALDENVRANRTLIDQLKMHLSKL